MESIDKLSFELLTNRRQYRKYLDKIDPKKFEETIELKEKSDKYQSRIIQEIKDYLSYETPRSFNPEIDELLPILIRQFIKYFEVEDMEKKHKNRLKSRREWQMDGPDEEDAEDSMDYEDGEGEEEEEEEGFDNEIKEESPIENEIISGQGFMKSYWGKSYIKKV